MHVFGLTGGIASGKSAVASRLKRRGVPVIDADILARDAVAKGSAALAEIVAKFGREMLLPDGDLDRKKLGREVFGDETKRAALNAIVHPRVGALTFQATATLRDDGAPLACYEAALIVENRLADQFRPLVVVSAPESVQIARAAARDASTTEEAAARVRAQMPLADKVKVADFVIENTGSLEELHRRVDEVLAAVCTQLAIDVGCYPAVVD